ncbi:hypothetical protein COY17_03100 [Candidatus Saccharibacteria bacterium CG_4_10_14_0_2_um_filter_52_9]|nr:MAG: hypothetical protein COY17_03100 [Candidatus Saccharibacteria bacterium CG_4_10_14_0_2_um_filter_52_9]
MKASRSTVRTSEAGFSALVIAMVLVLVLSLMTVGFAQLMRREQRSALDKQLSKQAYYAAETGLNDASKAINAGYALAKDTCEPFSQDFIDRQTAASGWDATQKQAAGFLTNNQISDNTASSYTCLTIDPAPKSLEYGSIDTEQSKAVRILGVDAAAPTTQKLIATLVISWNDSAGSAPFVTGAGTPFKPASQWSRTSGSVTEALAPVLRIGLTPLASGFVDRNSFISSTYSAFLYPKGSTTATSALANYPSSSYGQYKGINDSGGIVEGQCNSASKPRHCNVKITGLNSTFYLLNMRSIYGKAAVTITAYDSDGNLLRIKDAQTVVDSTGKSQDVLRRVQARIPAQNGYDHPDFSLETTGNLCKQLQLAPNSADGTNASDISQCNPAVN